MSHVGARFVLILKQVSSGETGRPPAADSGPQCPGVAARGAVRIACRIGDPFPSGAASCVTLCVTAGLVTCLPAAREYWLAARLPVLCFQACKRG